MWKRTGNSITSIVIAPAHYHNRFPQKPYTIHHKYHAKEDGAAWNTVDRRDAVLNHWGPVHRNECSWCHCCGVSDGMVHVWTARVDGKIDVSDCGSEQRRVRIDCVMEVRVNGWSKIWCWFCSDWASVTEAGCDDKYQGTTTDLCFFLTWKERGNMRLRKYCVVVIGKKKSDKSVWSYVSS